MKRKRFTALKVTLTAMMLTAALTFGAGSAYAADRHRRVEVSRQLQ